MKNVKPDKAYEFIRSRILSREFPPGHPLLTEQLSAAIGVSRTPVTEALVRLQADGLVTLTPRLGAQVRTLDFNELCEICEIRLALEAHAAGRAALRRTESDLRDIQSALESMRSITDRMISAEAIAPFFDDLVRADIRFHVEILTAAKNAMLKKEILRLHLTNRVVAGLYIEARTKAATESKEETNMNHRAEMASHEEIYDTIARGDAKGAKDAMERHIQEAIDKSFLLMGKEVETKERDLTPDELAYVG